jgi:hypothetical protein
LRVRSLNFHIHLLVSELYIPTIDLPILLQDILYSIWTNPGNICIARRHINVEIGTEAVQFPEKEYINGIFFAVLLTVFAFGRVPDQ